MTDRYLAIRRWVLAGLIMWIATGWLIQCSQRRPVSSTPDQIVADKTNLLYNVIAEGQPSVASMVKIDNLAGDPLSYDIKHKALWLSIFAHGTTPDTMFVSATGRDLLLGVFYDTVIITSPGALGSPITIPVTLNVFRGIKSGPRGFNLSWLIGEPTPAPRPLIVAPTGGGTMYYQIASSIPWLTLSSPTGIARDTQTATFHVDQYGVGTYPGQITVTAPEAANSPYVIPCTLSVQSWSLQSVGAAYGLRGIKFFSPTLGLAVGYQRIAFGRDGYLFRTTDGGSTWYSQLLSTSSGMLGMEFFSTNDGWAFGEDGLILRTADGGTNWHISSTGVQSINTMVTPATDTTYAFGAAGAMKATFDGGAHWIDLVSPVETALNSAAFINGHTGWVVGNAGVVLFTDDAAQTWSQFPVAGTTDLRGIYLKDSLNGWIVGSNGTILVRVDGAKWQLQSSPITNTLYQVKFLNATTGWIVGDVGTVLYTNDAGFSWQKQSTPTNLALTCVDFLDSLRAWVAGDNGVVMYTLNGGHEH
jgi:photosystem II stability/assembly factor-like uncharacterized protein